MLVCARTPYLRSFEIVKSCLVVSYEPSLRCSCKRNAQNSSPDTCRFSYFRNPGKVTLVTRWAREFDSHASKHDSLREAKHSRELDGLERPGLASLSWHKSARSFGAAFCTRQLPAIVRLHRSTSKCVVEPRCTAECRHEHCFDPNCASAAITWCSTIGQRLSGRYLRCTEHGESLNLEQGGLEWLCTDCGILPVEAGQPRPRNGHHLTVLCSKMVFSCLGIVPQAPFWTPCACKH